jgi:hypothetical protein
MVADYHSKPLQGKLCDKLRKQLMGHSDISFPSETCNDRSVLANQNAPFTPFQSPVTGIPDSHERFRASSDSSIQSHPYRY